MAINAATLKAILQSEKKAALAAQSASKVSADREDAMDCYLGDMSKHIPNLPGRSSVVSMDVADTIEGLMPSLMEIFSGGDEVVRFEPVGPEDVDAAQQETDYVNHVFMQKNPGFLILYSFIKDSLLSKVGVVKVVWEEEEDERVETYLDQSPDAFSLITSSPDIEVVAHTEHDGLHDVQVKTTKKYGCAKVYPVPPEEFGISRRARTIQGASYCFHEVPETQADLIAKGYDEDQLNGLSTYTISHISEEIARDTVQENSSIGTDDQMNRAARLIRITEHYCTLDYEESGKAKLYRVVTGGEQAEILKINGKDDVTEIDFAPFAAMTPIPVTHRFFGRSLADIVMDIQKIKTALVRALLDNAYLANNPRTEVPEPAVGNTTIDDLLVSRPGGIVRTKQAGMLKVLEHPDIGAHVYPLLQYQDSVREWRTGVSRQGQGLDADALQNQTATAANQLYNAAQARMKLIARIFAETGIKDLFGLLHATIRMHGQQAETVRLRNNWVQVDPRDWKERNDMTVNVGLGTGGKAERLSHLNIMANWQKEMVLGGKANLVTDENLYNTAKEFVKLLDLKTVEPYFTDPNSTQGQQAAQMQAQKPDPKLQEIQAQAQTDQQQMQMDAQIKEREMMMTAQAEQQRFEMEKELKLFEAQLKERDMLHEHSLKRELQAHDLALKGREHDAKMQLEVVKAKGQLATVKGEDGKDNVVAANDLGQTLIPLLHGISEHLKNAAAPKRIVRDKDGRTSHIETMQ